MPYLTKYGSLWGAVPETCGRVFWVAAGNSFTLEGTAYPASDDNDGLSPERPLRRVNRAWGLVTANVGDIIMLLPGTHSAAAAGTTTATSVAANIAGVTMMGLPSMTRGNAIRHRTILDIAAADEVINFTAADIEIGYISFIHSASQTAIPTTNFSAAANRLYIHDCMFDVATPAASTAIICIDALGAAANVVIENCVFHADGAFGAAIDMTAVTDSLIQGCVFNLSTGTWAACITTGAATDTLTIRKCYFNADAGTITVGINGTGATIVAGVLINDNIAGYGCTLVANFDSTEAELCNNYVGAAGTPGGALVTATA
jgi:hypothetical protein